MAAPFYDFAPLLRDITSIDLQAEIEAPKRFQMASSTVGSRNIQIAYAPFDHVVPSARLVIVGLTPGRQQMRNALLEAHRLLRLGASAEQTMIDAKVFASFSGPMRTNLVNMLDFIGVPQALEISSTASLWNEDAPLTHFTSALRYPVFVDGKNYSGAPSILATPVLRDQLMTWLAEEMTMLPKALYVPLGPAVSEAVEYVATQQGLPATQILSGLPHPSGANAERIAFFLGRKRREDLSTKVEPDRLLRARAVLREKISGLS